MAEEPRVQKHKAQLKEDKSLRTIRDVPEGDECVGDCTTEKKQKEFAVGSMDSEEEGNGNLERRAVNKMVDKSEIEPLGPLRYST